MNSQTQKIASGAIWSMAYNIFNAIYGFIVIPLLINYFGKSEYGMIGLAQSINLYIQLMDMGMNSTSIRFLSVWLAKGDQEKVNQLFQTCLSFYSIVGFLNAVIIFVLSFFTTSLFNITAEQGEVMQSLMWILTIAAFFNWYSSCFDQIIRATENVDWIQKRSFIPKLLQLIILLLTITLNWSLVLYFSTTTFAVFVILPLSISKIKKETPFIRFKPKFHKKVFREILPYTLNFFSFNIFKFSFTYLCPVFLGIRATLESITEYKIIYAVAGTITMITGTFLGALLPSASKIVAQNDKASYEKIAYKGTKILSLITSFCVFGLITVSYELLTIYVGDSYAHLVPWLQILTLVYLGNHILCISSLILAGTDISSLNRMVIFSSCSGLLAAWILIPYFQIGGVVIASIIYEILQMTFYYFYFMPRVMKIDSKKVFRSTIICIFCGALTYVIIAAIPFPFHSWLQLTCQSISFVLIFSLIATFILNHEEKNAILRIIRLKK